MRQFVEFEREAWNSSFIFERKLYFRRKACAPTYLKNAKSVFANVVTKTERSRNLLPRSQEVSGLNKQA
jgi:hypothetical protein